MNEIMDKDSICYNVKRLCITTTKIRELTAQLAKLQREQELILCALMVDVGEADFYENYMITSQNNNKEIEEQK